MPKLNVFLGEKLAGVVADGAGSPTELTFTYDPAWLNDPNRVRLSVSLPLRAERHDGLVTSPYFANLLPEGDPRDAIGRQLGIAPSDIMGMLEAIGRDCAGAVSVLPANAPTIDRSRFQFEPLSMAQLERRISELPERPLGISKSGEIEETEVQISLAGVQDKLALKAMGEGWAMPLNGAPSTHILKPEIKRLAGSAQNEAFCMMLAQLVGLHVPATRLIAIGERACLVVDRYDRDAANSDHIQRIHQEDFCQALSRWPNQKYEKQHGPSLADCFRILDDYSASVAQDRVQLMDAVIFNVLIGNVDAHAKNFSLLHRPKEGVRLAPFYDLMCGGIYQNITRNLAMAVGGQTAADHIYRKHWDRFAKEANLGPAPLRRRIEDLIDRVLTHLESAADRAAAPAGTDARKLLSDFIRARCTTVRQNLQYEDAAASRA